MARYALELVRFDGDMPRYLTPGIDQDAYTYPNREIAEKGLRYHSREVLPCYGRDATLTVAEYEPAHLRFERPEVQAKMGE